MTESKDMEAVIEAVLFVANDPVSRERLLQVFDEGEAEAAAAAIEAVVERYRGRIDAGIMIDEVAGGLRLVTRPELHGYLRRFFEVSGSNKLSMAALEALAIVAYRQPVTAPEIQELRGVNSSGVLKKLLERRMIRISGRKEVVGKPFLYGTTREFLMHFGLRSLKELPPLEQFEELFGGEAEAPEEDPVEDLEEEIDREAAELRDAEAEAAQSDEVEEIEAERRAAEAREEEEELAEQAAGMGLGPEDGEDGEGGEEEAEDEEDEEDEEGEASEEPADELPEAPEEEAPEEEAP